jgi:hypothetical protein
VQIGDNRAAEWVRRSNPVALGLLFSGLAGQACWHRQKPIMPRAILLYGAEENKLDAKKANV